MSFFAKKSLGQNFLNDQKIINLIAEIGNINSNDIVLEVGPGTGNLTEKILEREPKDFIIIEKDQKFQHIFIKNFNFISKFFNQVFC